jgi:hypothetical protein
MFVARGQILPVPLVGGEPQFHVRSQVVTERGGEPQFHTRGFPIPGTSASAPFDHKVLSWTLPTEVAGPADEAEIIIISGADKPNSSPVSDGIIIGMIDGLDPNAMAPDEQKLTGRLTPRCVGTSGGIGAGVKGCENSRGELIGEI